MKRISDELFVTGENRTYSLDDVIAIRIQDGEFYFLGWMENAERYSIQWAKSNSKIERDLLIASDDVYDAITSCKDYNKVENDWLMDDKGNLLKTIMNIVIHMKNFSHVLTHIREMENLIRMTIIFFS